MNKVLERSDPVGLFGSLILNDSKLVGLPAWEPSATPALLCPGKIEASQKDRIKAPNGDDLCLWAFQ